MLTGVTASAFVLTGCIDQYNDDRGQGDAPVAISISEGVLVVESADKYANTQYQALPGNVVVIQTVRDAQDPQVICSPELASSIRYTIEKYAPNHRDGDLPVQVPRLEVAPREWLEQNGEAFGLTDSCASSPFANELQ